MGKRWIMFFAIAMFGLLATITYAGPYMVVVIDVEKGDVKAVYDSKTMGTQKDGVSFDAHPVKPQAIGKNKITFNGKNVEAIADYTVIRTHSSPGCVTYTYGNYSWEVCT